MSKDWYDPEDAFLTLIDILHWRALHQPAQRAYTYLIDGEIEGSSLTYAELDRHARAIGALLQSRAATGERALLLYPAGLEFIGAFFGCLYAGVTAIPLPPPHPTQPQRTLPRLQAVTNNAQPLVALTTASILSKVERLFVQAPELQAIHWLATDNLASELAEEWQAPTVSSDTLALLQYTSGSTAAPKGVMVTYRNLLHNLALIHGCFETTADSRGVFWLPLYHDMGLIGGVMETLYCGGTSALLSPATFLQRPLRWLQAISRTQATISGGPNFAYELCVRKITPEQKATLDLSSWSVAFNGAEPIHHETLERFAAAFATCGFRPQAFYPCYGLAEGTLIVSGGLRTALPVVYSVQGAALEQHRVVAAGEPQDARTLVGCGQSRREQQIVIVDPDSCTPCSPGQVGEIWVAGPSVAQGYWHRPEDTEHTFHAYLADGGEGPFLRTGDLGFLQDGELFLTGRLKDLIIIAGRNHYPQDIEQTVEQSHPAIRAGYCAVFSVDIADEECLVVIAEVEQRRLPAQVQGQAKPRVDSERPLPLDIKTVVGTVRQAVADHHELQVHAVVLVKAGSIPKTSSGKLQRHICRERFLAGSLDVIGDCSQELEDGKPLTSPYGNRSDERAGSPQQAQTAEAIQAWLVAQIAARLKVNPHEIDIREPFARYGLDSVRAVSLAGELEEWLGQQLSPTLAYEYPTIETLAQHLAGDREGSESIRKDGHDRGVGTEPIAIIGLGCHFPGASNPEAFWHLLCNGVDAITEVPPERWDGNAFYDPNQATPGKMHTRWGGFLEQVDHFDPHFFGISPREAARIDPQQRLLLEMAWEALEDAGQGLEHLAGTRTGVFVGISTNDYSQIQLSDFNLIDGYTSTGNALSIAANRISYTFDFRGPSIAVDTACSSSLVAVHLACQSLWNGESTLALAGGVNLILSPASTISYSKLGAIAPDGRCKTFDARADGIVRGEGVGVVVLKPLSRALTDGDPIYAVIRGSAVNNDGRTNGLTAPSRQAQETMLREAYQQANVSRGQVQYIEAHGTGTLLGDPIEAKALGTVLATNRPPGCPCLIGSVKTNIGHLEAAAGIAGLIKVALSLKHGEIPPSLHFQEPNPHIPFDDLLLRVQTTLSPWPEHVGPALAGVSSFGFGGTNAHVVLEEAPQADGGMHGQWKSQAEAEGGRENSQAPILNPHRAFLLPLSARSPEALRSLARSFQDFLATPQPTISLQDICYTASVRRSHHDYRLAATGHVGEQLIKSLEAFLRGDTQPGLSSGCTVSNRRSKLVFVFPGQGSQWAGMGRQLLEQEPVFRETIERCDRAMRQYRDWSLLAELTATDEAQFRLNGIDIIHPTLFAVQVALAALWRSWGIEPDVVVGHSMGEVAAAYVAGALSLEHAVRIICCRSQLLKRMSGRGAMAAVELSWEQARHALAGYEDRVSIAVSNSPTSTVLSGDPAALEAILDRLQRQDIFCRLIKQVDVASHSPQMESLRVDLLQALEGLQPQSTSVPIYSTVTGEVSDGQECDATYWVRNLREPVLFSTAVQRLSEDGYEVFLEISPHPLLLNAIQQGCHHCGRTGTVLPSLRREEDEHVVMLSSLGALYTLGYSVDWNRLYPTGGRCIQLPSYPWQRERFCLEDQDSNRSRIWKRAVTRDGISHPLLGQYFTSAAHAGTHFWETDLGTDSLPYLNDHRVQGMIVLPAAAYVEIALAAATAAFGVGPHALKNVTFKKALFIPEVGPQIVQLILSLEMPGTASFQFFSRQADATPRQASWMLHATGTIQLGQAELAATPPEHDLPETIQTRCPEPISSTEHYQAMQKRGLQYGPRFQGVEQLWRQDGEAIGRLHLAETVELDAGAYQLHPAVLDACFQVLAATSPRHNPDVADGATYLPVGLDSLCIYNRPQLGARLWGHALLRPGTEANADSLKGDVFLLDESGQAVLEALGLSLQRLDSGVQRGTEQDPSNWLYEIHWEPKAPPQPDQAQELLPPDQRSSWLIFTDSRGVGQTLRSLLETRGETCLMVSPGETYQVVEPGHWQLNPARPEEFQQLLKDALGSDHPPCCGVVHLWSLEAPPPEQTTLASLEATQVLSCGSTLHLVQALAKVGQAKSPHLWLVTAGAQTVRAEGESLAIAQSPLWGLGRVIFHEYPELRCTTVDLSSAARPDERESLFQELWFDDAEDQLLLRGDLRYVARLVRYAPKDQTIDHRPHTTGPGLQITDHSLVPPPFRLEIEKPGILDNLTLRARPRQKPGPGQIEIQVCAVGLNFRDVLYAMGVLPPVSEDTAGVGWEGAGKIVALGDGVEGFQLGDEVMAFAPFSFSAFTTTVAPLVIPKPAHLSFEEAATIPIAFSTACYALSHLSKLRKGERILIHAAAGGVGLAAVQLAQRVGAEIFATAGNPGKREFLKSLGVHHVMDSRSLDFAEEVMQRTDGKGVDVVLNSLAGEFIPKSLSVLGPYGRFIEIGKADILQNNLVGLGNFRNNQSFFAIDLSTLFLQRPEIGAALLGEVMQYFAEGALKPLPYQVFPISQAVTAFRHMAQAKHIGKIVVSLRDQEGVRIEGQTPLPVTLHADGTYLITGGLGGIGLSVAQWMVHQGARHLVLMGRSGASASAQESVNALRETGAQVVVAKADVAQVQQVAGVLAEIEQTMPPVRGIIHAAAVLDDGILLQQDQERFKVVMAPKISGAWNLHQLTVTASLDFFILFSSAAALLGSPGQGNYAAANAFLDALAHYRRDQGLPALSINWGPWREVGLAAAQANRGERLAFRGFGSISPKQGLEVLGRLLGQGSAQVGVVPFNWQQWGQFYPASNASALLTHLASEQVNVSPKGDDRQGKRGLTHDTVLATEPEGRQRLLESYFSEQIAAVLGLSASGLSKLDIRQPLNRLGIDSLMAMELKNRVQTDLNVLVSVVYLLEGPSITQMATYVLDQLATATSPLSVVPNGGEDSEHLLTNLDQLSDEEVESLLDAMLTEEEGAVRG